MTQVKSSKGFEEYIGDSMSYDEYLELIDRLLIEGKTTGPEQSEELLNFGKLNRQRMKRLGKTVKIDKGLIEAAHLLTRPLFWLILTEGWCGDAAQNIPVIEKIAAESDLITTHYVLRDENLELMDQFLTKGGRSIPKLICIDAETLAVLGEWGSRPAGAQEYYFDMRDKGMEKADMMENLQRWYLKDKENAIQSEFVELLKKWA